MGEELMFCAKAVPDTPLQVDYVALSELAHQGMVQPPKSKALGTNPKDILGSAKIDATKVSAIALAHESFAMMDGAEKYGAYNWRDKAVLASIYVAACKRHLDAWFEGEENASDSFAHHLGHARACLGILLDAQETGNLIDDRPINESSKGVLGRVMNDLVERLKKRRAIRAAEKAAKDAAANGSGSQA